MRFILILLAACGGAPTREHAKSTTDPQAERQAAIEKAQQDGLLGRPIQNEGTFVSLTGTSASKPAYEPTSGSVTIALPKVSGDLDPDTVQHRVVGISPELGRCHGNGVEVELDAMITVRPDGRVKSAGITGGAGGDRELGSCVRKLIEKLSFPSAANPSYILLNIKLE
jgi:hypothetical protein